MRRYNRYALDQLRFNETRVDILKMRFLHGPWLFAIAGSLLILLSTFILGVITFKKEQNLLKVQKNISVTESERQKAQQYYDTASMEVRLAVIQNSVLKHSISKDANLEEKSREVYVKSLHAALLRFFLAAGEPVIKQEQVENLKQLSAKAIEGDNGALQKLNSLILELLLKSDKYREKLKIEKDNLEKAEDELRQAIIDWRYWALILQIVGLVLLLTKEFPDYLWGSKKRNEK